MFFLVRSLQRQPLCLHSALEVPTKGSPRPNLSDGADMASSQMRQAPGPPANVPPGPPRSATGFPAVDPVDAWQPRNQASVILFQIDRLEKLTAAGGASVLEDVSRIAFKSCAARVRASDVIRSLGSRCPGVRVLGLGIDVRHALKVAERLRGTIEQLRFEPLTPLAITASFGVGDVIEGDAAAATGRALLAMNNAQASGGNRCVVHLHPAQSSLA